MAERSLVSGLTLLVIVVLGRLIARLPRTPALFYLLLGYFIGGRGTFSPTLAQAEQAQ